MIRIKKKIPFIVSIGEVLWDILPTARNLGGAPLNLLYYGIRSGANGAIISALGKDDLGKEAFLKISEANVTKLIEINDKPTGKVIVELNDGIPSYEIIEDVAFDNISVINKEIIEVLKTADAITFGTLALRSNVSNFTIKKMLSIVPEKTLRFFDINLRGNYYSSKLIDELLLVANVLKINDDELKTLKDIFDLDGNENEICLFLKQKYNLKYLILTAGARYSLIYYDDKVSKMSSPKIKVADTVGAGDAFSGTFLSYILQGKTVAKAHEKAVTVAAKACMKYGAW